MLPREIIMTTNLTIELDSGLLEKINLYARKSGKTVAELVEDQLKRILQTQVEEKSKPVSSKLRGIVKLPADFDYKEEMEGRV